MFNKATKIIALILTMLMCATLTVACIDMSTTSHECQHACKYCGKCADADCVEKVCLIKCQCPPIEVRKSSWKMLIGTIYETTVYKFETDRQGPKIAIVGGIHGDETAGWTAGLQLVDSIADEQGFCGEVLIISTASALAVLRQERYPAINLPNKTLNGVKYSDLNRSFPLARATSATLATIAISDAIVAEVEAFDADYIIDLHESQNSWTQIGVVNTTLGDTLIFNNQVFFMDELLELYNSKYRPSQEVMFTSAEANQKGTFSYYFTNTYPDKVVFTIETNRLRISGVDTMPLSTRVRQQKDVIYALLDLVWERI